ncbi:hypothetical protein A1356_17090 [Methylomonas koyamae]|uniref:Uncharacterized protein n=1 Tax=Methylomonas koyamae TaxID=702114 RepID=A0AA91DAK3_9GAMM|nr:hypothetical protein A1356_17090 [Methylomonas koyamae]
MTEAIFDAGVCGIPPASGASIVGKLQQADTMKAAITIHRADLAVAITIGVLLVYVVGFGISVERPMLHATIAIS